jgi:hypothetical protein
MPGAEWPVETVKSVIQTTMVKSQAVESWKLAGPDFQ